jgi:hypothetical protein
MEQDIKRGGGQPLSYTNPTIYEPAAAAGQPLLLASGTIARPELIQRGGQPLSYVLPNIYEPAADAGQPLLLSAGTVARPELVQKGGQPLSYPNPLYVDPALAQGAPLVYVQQQGGFTPSIMTNLVTNGRYLIPAAGTAAYRLLSNQKTRKQHGGKSWEEYRAQAKYNLNKIAPGRANGRWINKLAKARRELQGNADILRNFAAAKGVDEGYRRPAVTPKRNDFAKKYGDWAQNRRIAKEELALYGKPSGPNIVKYAALKSGRRGEPGNNAKFLEEFKKRQAARTPRAPATPVVAEERKPLLVPKPKQPMPPIVLTATRKSARVPKPRVQFQGVTPVKSTVRAPRAPKVEEVDFNKRPWGEIRANAVTELRKYGKPKVGNISTYARLLKTKNMKRQTNFMEEYKKRPAPEEKPKSVTRKGKSESRQEWEKYQSGARRMLERIGPATIAEISVLAKMMRDGDDIRTYVTDFEDRVKRTKVRLDRLDKEKREREERDRRERQEAKEQDAEDFPAPPPRTAMPPPPRREAAPPPPRREAAPPPPRREPVPPPAFGAPPPPPKVASVRPDQYAQLLARLRHYAQEGNE